MVLERQAFLDGRQNDAVLGIQNTGHSKLSVGFVLFVCFTALHNMVKIDFGSTFIIELCSEVSFIGLPFFRQFILKSISNKTPHSMTPQ